MTSVGTGTGLTGTVTTSGSLSLDTTYTDGRYVNKAGDTMTGNLQVNGNIIASAPTADSHVATKAYVDANSGGSPGGWTCTVRTSSGSTGAGSQISRTAACTGNEKLITGGCYATGSYTYSYPSNSGQGWYCYSHHGVATHQVAAYANCCS